MQSDTADNVAWARYAPAPVSDAISSHSATSSASSKPRVEFKHIHTPIPLHAAIQEATAVTVSSPDRKEVVVVITGRSRRLAVENHRGELKMMLDEHGQVGAEVRKTVGDVATAFMVSGVGSGVVVVQAAVSTTL